MKEWLLSQGYSEQVVTEFISHGYVPSGMYDPSIGWVADMQCAALYGAKENEHED